MEAKTHAQISVEYLVIIGFVTFIIIGILAVSLVYQTEIQDTINLNQIERLTNKIITSAEEVFYSGEPSRVTITGYMPKGVEGIEIIGKQMVFNITTSSGPARIAYTSEVQLEGNLSLSEGIKRIELIAESDKVLIND